MKEHNQNKKRFVEFLRENNAVIPFCINLSIKRRKSLSKYLNSTMVKRYPINAFRGAFPWAGTKEEAEFWVELSKKWQDKFSPITLKYRGRYSPKTS